MARRHYVAIIEQDEGGFSVFFPDLPGCVTAGDTITEAAVNAEEAATGWIEVTAEHGEPIPEPSPIERIAVDPDVREAARVLVPVDVPDYETRIEITLPEALIRAIDHMAAARGEDRSTFIAKAAQYFLREIRGV